MRDPSQSDQPFTPEEKGGDTSDNNPLRRTGPGDGAAQTETGPHYSDEEYREIFENSVEGFFQSTPAGRFIRVNRSLARMYGYDSPFQMISGITDIGSQTYVHREDRDTFVRLLETEGKIEGFEHQAYRRDGTVFWTSVTARAVGGTNSRSPYFEGTIVDIDTRKKAELLLSDAKEQYQTLFDTSTNAILIRNSDGVITMANRACLDLLGARSVDDLKGRAYLDFVHPDDRSLSQERVRAILTSAERRAGNRSEQIVVQPREHRLVRTDGTIVDVESTGSAFHYKGAIFIQGIFRDISDRKQAEKALVESVNRLRRAVNTTIQVLVRAVEQRDPYTAGHQRRVTALAEAIAKAAGLPPEKVEGIRMAAYIHDIGKLSVPSEILSKPSALSEMEYSLVRFHARQGYDILRDIESPWPLADIVHQHHERIDGSGYPQGLSGDEILIESRILAVADVVESMVSHRPYRPAFDITYALDEITSNRGILYDREIVDICVTLFLQQGFVFGNESETV